MQKRKDRLSISKLQMYGCCSFCFLSSTSSSFPDFCRLHIFTLRQSCRRHHYSRPPVRAVHYSFSAVFGQSNFCALSPQRELSCHSKSSCSCFLHCRSAKVFLASRDRDLPGWSSTSSNLSNSFISEFDRFLFGCQASKHIRGVFKVFTTKKTSRAHSLTTIC